MRIAVQHRHGLHFWFRIRQCGAVVVLVVILLLAGLGDNHRNLQIVAASDNDASSRQEEVTSSTVVGNPRSLQREVTQPPPPVYNVKRFVLITTARSGSGWTIRMLDSHPRISVQNREPLGQIFEKYGGEGFDNITWEGDSTSFGWKRHLEVIFAQRCSTRAAALTGKEIACGFKVLYDQIPDQFRNRIFQYFAEENIAVIHLVRANVLRTEVSYRFYLRDTKEGYQSHSSNASEGIRDPFHFDPKPFTNRLKNRIAKIQAFRALIARYMPSNSFEIEYSEITENVHDDTADARDSFSGGNPQCNALLAFLDPRLVGFDCRTSNDKNHLVVQQHGYLPCSTAVTNWEEVVKRLGNALNPAWTDLILADCLEGDVADGRFL